MWGFGKKSKHSLKSTDATNKVKGPSKADASTTAPRFQSPGTPFVAPMDPYALYFSIPVNCAGDFNDALKRFSRRHPPCVDSVTNRRGQPHKVYIRKNFMILRNLLAFLTGGQQYVHKGFRIRDLYYVRRTLINLLLEPQRGAGMDPENPAGSVMESASTVELSPLATPDAEVIEVVDEDDSQSDAVKGDGTFESKYIIEDERATDLYGSIRRALLTNQTQQLQSVGHYVSNMAFSAPPGLLEFTAWLEALFASRITAGREEAAGGMISFDSLEHIYKPGDFIYGCHEETGTSYIGLRVTKAEYRILRSDFGTSRSFRVEAECIVATGNDSFVNCSHHFTKGEFLGRRSIDTLEWRPMTSAIRELLIMRGRKYVELSNGHHFMAYASSGFSIHRHSTGHVARSAFLRTTGRVMIDNSTAVRLGHFPCNSFSTWGFSGSVVGALKLASQQADLADQAQLNQYNAYHGQNNNNANNAAFSKIPISFLPLTYPAVAGFSFTSKTWGHCLVDAISEIKFNERAFDQLVMAPSRKALIRALVIHTNDLFADIIQGKGSSTVFLLHGPPGSGKTLSAESIAESLHKPLYSITMGELGVTPQMLEERIQEVLQLASLWGCLVLIDEADIVVERRNTKDLKRNALVGILLRQLEYFNGVLFLTSNRVSVFDEAVHSRVTIALKYKALSRKSRLDVWRVLLDAAGVTDIDPTPLAEYRMNGRQIKNAIRLGEALAKAHGESLSLSHLQHTIAVSKEFLDLLHESNGDQVEEERESDHEDDDRLTRVFAPSSSSMLPEEMTGDDWNDDMMKLKRPPL